MLLKIRNSKKQTNQLIEERNELIRARYYNHTGASSRVLRIDGLSGGVPLLPARAELVYVVGRGDTVLVLRGCWSFAGPAGYRSSYTCIL